MKKFFITFLCFIITFSILILSACDKKDNLSINNNEKEKIIALSKETDNLLDLNIYFNSSKDPNTVEISKESRIIKKDELFAETIINELIKGPSVKSNLTPILPKNTRIISMSIKDNIAYLNLSEEANIEMTSIKEETCLKSIVFSLTQISTINKVKISINNKDSGIWSNNFDLSKPIGKDDIENARKK
ncbi:GerMN domain-containing protein [Clostridium kluyveri]|uniref:GerMN domain-containing protein n=2 Tax=Clostridium kluyveri TaxID=1534 RepID=A5N4G4_CLOK5|nr:GerMN domain-containing protein [Clostridium kluyveri]EDK32195.1 Conserved hypothetical protein [Clostridium kluyveri DSM 555]